MPLPYTPNRNHLLNSIIFIQSRHRRGLIRALATLLDVTIKHCLLIPAKTVKWKE